MLAAIKLPKVAAAARGEGTLLRLPGCDHQEPARTAMMTITTSISMMVKRRTGGERSWRRDPGDFQAKKSPGVVATVSDISNPNPANDSDARVGACALFGDDRCKAVDPTAGRARQCSAR
jgi:hypothetical protein